MRHRPETDVISGSSGGGSRRLAGTSTTPTVWIDAPAIGNDSPGMQARGSIAIRITSDNGS